MSRSGDEMMLALAGLLNKQDAKVVTAAKKDDDKDDKKEEKDDKKDDKEDDKDEKKEEDKKDKKDDKEDKKDKKASVLMGVLNQLTKLASELDDAGADEASAVVDAALRTIVKDLKK